MNYLYDVKESGKRIKELRKQAGYTQETFAAKINMSHRTYSGIESGAHSTSIETFVDISNTLGCTLDYIIKGKESETIEIPKDLSENKRIMLNLFLKNLL